jgi:acetyl esterase
MSAQPAKRETIGVWIDPEMAEIFSEMRANPAPQYELMDISEARAAFERVNAIWNIDPPMMLERRELKIPSRSGELRARLYRPDNQKNQPVAVYVHGGGWTFGSIDTHDRTMAVLAAESGVAVLGIDYRLAPEFPFPAAIDDISDAIDAIRTGHLGDVVDPENCALIGDSAGAALVFSAMLGIADRSIIRSAVLVYGCYAPAFDTGSHRQFGNGEYPLGLTEFLNQAE